MCLCTYILYMCIRTYIYIYGVVYTHTYTYRYICMYSMYVHIFCTYMQFTPPALAMSNFFITRFKSMV
jgi:hypothetical protein